MRYLGLGLMLAAAMVLAGCNPATSTGPLVQTPADPVAQCAAQGGELRGVCRRQTRQCVVPYPDAGRPCTDGDQCAGDCLAPDGEPGHTAGVCQADNDPCGCRFTIEDGRPAQGVCVD
jgi:predicted small secreted protein